jgi:hypothetical protein
VAVLARGHTGLPAAGRDVEAAGGALEVPVDLDDAEAVEAAADRVEAELGPIDVWVDTPPFTRVPVRGLRRKQLALSTHHGLAAAGAAVAAGAAGALAALRR